MSLSVDKVLRKAQSLMKAGELAEAEELYKQVLSKFPKNKKAIQGYQKLKAGIASKGSSSSEPSQEQVNELVGLYTHGQFEEVLSKLKPLVSLFNKAVSLHNLQGASNAALERYDAAIESYEQAIKINPNYADAHLNKGSALQEKGEFDLAIKSFYETLSINPKAEIAYFNIGNALHKKGELGAAVDSYQKALMINSDYTEAYFNKGNVLREQGKFTQAVEAYEQTLKIKTNHAEAYNNMGISLNLQGDESAAVESYNQAIKIKPDYAEAHHNLGFAFLTAGRLKEGLDEHEWRWRTAGGLSQKRHFSQAMWDGIENLKCKRILLWSEQGPGDVVTWSSCLSLVASQAEICILECQEKLVPLFVRSFPNVEVKVENKSLDTGGDDFDVHLPMGSLFRHFIPEISKEIKPDAFLIPDPARVNFWKERLNSLGKGPYVGISWKSPFMTPARLPNYTQISDWAPVLTLPNVTFINLQCSDFRDDLASILDEFGTTVHHFDDLNHYDDLDDVAALSAALDIAVSVSTAVSTITAGVGTPTKMLHWRQSPWNNILLTPPGPFVDVFERNTWEPWDNVFHSVAIDIAKFQVA